MRPEIFSRDAANADRCAAIGVDGLEIPESGDGLTTDIVGDVAGIRSLAADYEHLYRVTANTLPFALQEWHLSWCAHLLSRSPRIDEQPLFCVLRSRSGECIAIVPLILTRRQCGPVRLATVALLGGDPGLTEIRNPLVKPGYERSTVRAVHERLANAGDWHWIHWSGISQALTEAMSDEAHPQWLESSDDYVLTLPSSWEEFRAGWKRNVRESIRHCYNSLRRDRHSFEFVVTRERAELPRALDRLLELHTMRANMPRGPRHPDRFAARSLRTFLYDVCDRLATRDAVRLFQLKIAGKIVAARLGFVVGDSLYLYYSGFDPAWARYSVMTTTVAEAFKYAIARGLQSVNLSPTGEQSKLRWRPRRVEFHSALILSKLVTSRILYRMHRTIVSSDGASARLLRSLWAQRNWD